MAICKQQVLTLLVDGHRCDHNGNLRMFFCHGHFIMYQRQVLTKGFAFYALQEDVENTIQQGVECMHTVDIRGRAVSPQALSITFRVSTTHKHRPRLDYTVCSMTSFQCAYTVQKGPDLIQTVF